jgi:AmiR/NasT family two-component response regulator
MITATETTPIKVLIVEDEAAIAMELHMRIAELGHTAVGPAATGARALALAEQERPHVALMDIHLAGPQDGVAAAGELRARFGIPVIFVTAYSSPELVARAKPAQPLGWLVKPFGDRELQITVELGLHRHAAEQQLRETNRQLAQALTEVKKLSGMLPICAQCKKIRDDQNYWHTVEEYICSHSEATFSHGFCPECYRAYLKQYGLNDRSPSDSQS